MVFFVAQCLLSQTMNLRFRCLTLSLGFCSRLLSSLSLKSVTYHPVFQLKTAAEINLTRGYCIRTVSQGGSAFLKFSNSNPQSHTDIHTLAFEALLLFAEYTANESQKITKRQKTIFGNTRFLPRIKQSKEFYYSNLINKTTRIPLIGSAHQCPDGKTYYRNIIIFFVFTMLSRRYNQI